MQVKKNVRNKLVSLYKARHSLTFILSPAIKIVMFSIRVTHSVSILNALQFGLTKSVYLFSFFGKQKKNYTTDSKI